MTVSHKDIILSKVTFLYEVAPEIAVLREGIFLLSFFIYLFIYLF